jgi:hypothetical protein
MWNLEFKKDDLKVVEGLLAKGKEMGERERQERIVRRMDITKA